jgi:FkbM family methyltransferase
MGNGVFVEVGAFDGESWSNTSFLADQGWRGIYVEPIPRYFRRMMLRHAFNNVKGENVGIADSSGTAEIDVMGPLSTINRAVADPYSRLGWSPRFARGAKAATIRTERLEDALTRNAVPHDFNLMVVDVEGSEETIITSLLSSEWRPRVLIIELCDVHPDFASNAELVGSHARVRGSVVSAGYREHFIDPINTIFALNMTHST